MIDPSDLGILSLTMPIIYYTISLFFTVKHRLFIAFMIYLSMTTISGLTVGYVLFLENSRLKRNSLSLQDHLVTGILFAPLIIPIGIGIRFFSKDVIVVKSR
jgi:hypothetical protein